MAQNLLINGSVFNGVESIDMVNANGEHVTYVEKVNTGTGVPVAKIGSVEYETVKEALENAKSGDVVEMIADSDESESTLLIRPGVTLYLKVFDLHANAVFGAEGGLLYGEAYHATNDYAKLFVNTLVLGETPYVDSSNLSYLPVFKVNHYVFSKYRIITEYNETGLRVTEDQIHFQFAQQLTGAVRTQLLADNGGSDNEFFVEAVISWNVGENEQKIIYTYGDDFVKGASSNTTTHYTWALNGYEAMNVDFATLKAYARARTLSGAIANGEICYDKNAV